MEQSSLPQATLMSPSEFILDGFSFRNSHSGHHHDNKLCFLAFVTV